MTQPYRILVVDDSRDAAFLLKILLAKIGHTVEIASDGRSAICAAQAEPPDIVFCDISMLGMDGYQVAEQMRADETTRGAYLVALTGYGNDADRARALQSGFDAHLVKPVGLSVLQATIEEVEKRREGRSDVR